MLGPWQRTKKKKKKKKLVEYECNGDTNYNWRTWNGAPRLGLEKLETGRIIETIQTTALLRSARIQRKVIET